VLKLLQQKPQQCGAIKTVELILQVLTTGDKNFETDDNYSIRFEMKNTTRTAPLSRGYLETNIDQTDESLVKGC